MVNYKRPTDEPTLNPNVAWTREKFAWSGYIAIVIGFRFFLTVLRFDEHTAWTTTHLLHAVFTWFAFHWVRGSPFGEEFDDQGKYNKYTWWEQIDNGRQNTPSRKFLTIFPVVLYLLTCHYTGYHFPTLLVNSVALAVLLISKLPEMHKVRIFGINKWP
mmetsp:Transcript_37361/g.60502  ORF Transcript_37361/g.60502 Transcript_37361/m.60502 type:complete len:159 (+) Transcript_37361:83-559(+)